MGMRIVLLFAIGWVMGRLELGITVDTLLDEVDGLIDDGDASLRDAIAAAAPNETIVFDPALNGGTILLTLGALRIAESVTIDATGLPVGLTIDASGLVDLFCNHFSGFFLRITQKRGPAGNGEHRAHLICR